MSSPLFRSTTILCVRRNGRVALGGDGQVSLRGDTIVKQNANKLRRLADGRIVAGFAGSVGDALTLLERFEEKLRTHGNNLLRSAVELARDWRTDKMLTRLEAMLILADAERSLLVSGTGEIIEPDDGVLAIGSGGGFARSAGLALLRHTDLTAVEITQKALEIAADICVYTNHQIQILELPETSAN